MLSIRKFSKVELLIFTLMLLLVFIMAARAPLDSDMWWHLRAGEQTWSDGAPLRVDVFSHTRHGEKWINHSWLAQVGMYLLFQWQGFIALSGITALLAALSMGAVYLQMDGPALLKTALVILGSLVAAVIWSPRPQMLSFFLLAIVLYLLYSFRRKEKNRLWVFLPLFVLWSNLHAGYTLGLMAIGLTIAGWGLDHILAPGAPENMPWKKILMLCGWGAAAGLAVLLNPNGIDTWMVPFQTVNVDALQQFVVEWSSPDFHDVSQQPFLWLLLALVAVFGFSQKKADGADILLVTWFAYLSLVARRNFGPFALVSLPVLSHHLAPLFEKTVLWLRERVGTDTQLGKYISGDKKEQQLEQPVFKKIINLSLVGLLALMAMGKLVVVSHPAWMRLFLSRQYPVEAVESIAQLEISENLLNEYNWGGFLVWQLRDCPVFVDGRTDLFGDEVIGEWIKLVNGEPGWEEALESRNVRLILLTPDRPLAQHLDQAGNWKLVYEDGKAVVYRQTSGSIQ